MKIICDEISSTEIVELFSKFDEHRERYISVEWIELTKVFVSRRLNVGDPLRQIEVDCIKVRGKSLLGWSGDSTNGTRYIYGGEILFTHLSNWSLEKLQIRREEKIIEILK
jgi:hypothetical protein